MNEHNSRSIMLKREWIDIKMIPVVEWLNSFDSVATWYCCEGDKSSVSAGFVTFTCYDPMDLLVICKATNPGCWEYGEFGPPEIKVYEEPEACIRYTLEFSGGPEHVELFARSL